MKKLMAFVLALVCVLVLLAGCAAAKQENGARHTNTVDKEFAEAADDMNTFAETGDRSEIPGATTFVVDIWDRTEEEQLACDSALEKFYEDETSAYYFSCIKSHYIMVLDNTGRTIDIVTALNEGLAAISDLDRFGIQYWAEPKTDDLDIAISRAVLGRCRSDKPDGLICAESHLRLASETMSGTPWVGADDHAEEIVVYLLVYYGKYSPYGGVLEEVAGNCVPAAITFRGGSGEYILEEYWEPRDGKCYEDDIRTRFPGAAADGALNGQAYTEVLKEQAYNKALAYLNGIGSPAAGSAA